MFAHGAARIREHAVPVTWIVCAALLGASGCSGDAPDGRPQPSASSVDDVATIVSQLKKLQTEPESVAAQGVPELAGDPRSAFPPDTKITPDPKSWAPDGTGSGGTMTATVSSPGQARQDFLVLVVKEGKEWKVLATVAADEVAEP